MANANDLPDIQAGDSIETAATARQWQNLSRTVRALSSQPGSGSGVTFNRVGAVGQWVAQRGYEQPPVPRDVFVGILEIPVNATQLVCRRVGYHTGPRLVPGPDDQGERDRYQLIWRGAPFLAYPQFGRTVEDYRGLSLEAGNYSDPPRLDGHYVRAYWTSNVWMIELPGQALAEFPVVVRERDFTALGSTLLVQELSWMAEQHRWGFADAPMVVNTWWGTRTRDYAAMYWGGNELTSGNQFATVLIAKLMPDGEVYVTQSPGRFRFGLPPDPELRFHDCRIPSRGTIRI